jgi:membrane-bound lytic murein transglycosylase B
MSLHRNIKVSLTAFFAALSLSFAIFTECFANQTQAIDKFIDEMVEKNDFDREYLQNLFSQIHMDPVVTAKMDKPYEAKPWGTYRNFFLTQDRIDNGVKYWQEHATDLARAEKMHGVPASIIVAIIAVESKYGTEPMKFPVFQTLATFAFNYPKRAPFFTSELEHFLLLSREQAFNPLEIKGSYAGALGIPQFMPKSYRFYAVNLEGAKKADLINNHADAISSIGNYLKKNGWHANQPVAFQVNASEAAMKSIKQEPLKTLYTLNQLRQKGVSWKNALSPNTAATFFTLDYEDQPQAWIGLNNFIVISRYNHNVQYALAVHELSEAIKTQRKLALRAEQKAQRPSPSIQSNTVAQYEGEAELLADSPTN